MRCPRPDKVPYANRLEANAALLEIWSKNRPECATAAYACVCGSYHLTHWKQTPDGRGIRPARTDT